MLFIIHLTLDNWQSNIAKPSEGDLDEFLASNSIQREKVLGEVLFVSLAIMIKQQLGKGILTAEGRTRLQQLGVIQGENFEINHIASALRHVIVNEWLSNPSLYEPFLTSGQDYETEANLFLQDGHFASELGNSIPLAASNALSPNCSVYSYVELPITTNKPTT